jgi:EmrB/QacA subfamily drug resistance transporter
MSVFLTGLDSTIVTIALPTVGRSLHVGVSGLQWSVTGYTVTLASLLMSSGAAADRIGRRQVLQAGLALFVLGSWLCTLAPSRGWLVGARVIQGIGASCMNPAALGIITSTITSPSRRARAIGIWDAAYSLSMVVGPLAGGTLTRIAGWRAIFDPGIVAGLAALALTAMVAPESRAPSARRPDPVGQVLVIVLLATIATAIIQVPGWGWRAPRTAAVAAPAVVALAALLWAETRRPDGLIPLALFRRASFTGACLMGLSGIAALAGAGFLCSLYLQDARSMSALQAALAIWPMPAAMAAFAPVAGIVMARYGSRIPAVAAGAALTASSVALARLTGAGCPTCAITIAYALFGGGMGLLSPAITHGIMSGLADEQAGLASAMNSSSRQLGQCLGVAVIGAVLAGGLHGTSPLGYLAGTRTGWLVIAGCGLCVLLTGLATAPRRANEHSGCPL